MNKTEFTKRCIADALFELLKVKNYNSISIKELTEKAGFSRMSYYRNFKSLEEVLHFFLNVKFTDRFNNQSFNIKNINDAIPFFLVSVNNKEQREIEQVFINRGLENIIFENNRRRIIALSKPSRLQANLFINGGFNEVWYNWVINGYKETPEQLCELLQRQINLDLERIFAESTSNKKYYKYPAKMF